MSDMPDTPDAANMQQWIAKHSNWGRWGADDQTGAINLVTPERLIAAARCVREGVAISLSRPLSTRASPINRNPIEHDLSRFDQQNGGGAGERIALRVHGYDVTHIDALGHAWGNRGVWNGGNAGEAFASDGLRVNAIDQWRNGIMTRGVLLDMARWRGQPHVGTERPVTGNELEAALAQTGVTPRSGDALIVYLGRDAFEAEFPDWDPHSDPHPGLGASALAFLRRHDFSVMLWDLMDFRPYEVGWPHVPHAALFELGVALVDNCSLERLARACEERARNEVMVLIAPLYLPGGTGSPVNPIAVL